MKMCQPHWNMMRESIAEKGLDGLVAKSGEVVVESEVRQLEEFAQTGEVSEKTQKETFDPLMSMHWHFANNAIKYGGLYLLGQKEDGSDYCPICEFETHAKGFEAKTSIDSVASQMREYCIAEGMIPKPS